MSIVIMPSQRTRANRKRKAIHLITVYFPEINMNYDNTTETSIERKNKEIDVVYSILYRYDELSAYYDGRYNTELDICIKYFKNNLPNEARVLLVNALLQEFYLPNDGYCPYYRPSLLLLNKEWMKSQGYKFIAKEKTEKSTFRKIYGSFTEEANKINLHREV